MPRPCSICPHPARKAIDRAIIAGESIRGLARQHGVGAESIRRHRDNHLSQALSRAIESERIEVDAEALIGWAGNLHARTLLLLERAESLDDLAKARGLIGEARKNLELLGRLGGVLDGPTVHVDARRQVAVLGRLSEEELRALAAGDVAGDVVEVEGRELAS